MDTKNGMKNECKKWVQKLDMKVDTKMDTETGFVKRVWKIETWSGYRRWSKQSIFFFIHFFLSQVHNIPQRVVMESPTVLTGQNTQTFNTSI